MAASRGHTVVVTPPYLSDLQPIEMVWSYVKGVVGRQYDTSTKFPGVRKRLDRAFEDLPSCMVNNCIRHTERKVADTSLYRESLNAADDTTKSSSEEGSEIGSDDCAFSYVGES